MFIALPQLVSPTTTPLPAPLVLYRGEAVPELFVVSFTHRGPLDERTAVLRLRRNAGGYEPLERSRAERWIGESVEIHQPLKLEGGEETMFPLLRGRVTASAQQLADREDEIELTVECDWTQALRGVARVDVFPTRASSGASHGLEQHQPVAPTLRDAVASLGLDIATHLLPPWVALRTVPPSHMRGSTVGAVLKNIHEHHALSLRREPTLHGENIREHRSLVTLAQGRPIRLGLGALANPAGAVRSLRAAIRAARPIQRIASADPQAVESTFNLQPAWRSDETQQPDAQYAKSTSGNFDAVAHVFRLWLLNEDAALPDAPTFDLAALFEEEIEAQPLRFTPTLTQDASGRSLGFVVETSTDGGVSYTRYGGAVKIMIDRAGVYLDDEALPATYLAAARNGRARLRITATLQSPNPLESVRWVGNPFAGEFDTQALDVSGAFAYRRVTPGSKFHSSGLPADTADDRGRMIQWLALQPVRRSERGKAVVVTVSIAPTLRLGDRLDQLAHRRIAPDLPDPAGAEPAAILVNITHDYAKDRSRLEWEI